MTRGVLPVGIELNLMPDKHKNIIMNTELLSDKIELTELANKLFMFCDAQQWPQMLTEVFTENIHFDMTSAGGATPQVLEARAVCEIWREGFKGIDAIQHQAGHYLITVNGDKADIFGYAVAYHYKKAATNGHTRSFTGSYELKAIRTTLGWRLTQFKYNLKFIDGNATLE
jgi:hypothetical protein